VAKNEPAVLGEGRAEELGQEADGKLTDRVQGKLYVRGDSKIFRFQNGKTESLFLQRKNPRRIAWTVLFRRQHKKGISEVWNFLQISPRRGNGLWKQQRKHLKDRG
jgi:ribosomal protein L24E